MKRIIENLAENSGIFVRRGFCAGFTVFTVLFFATALGWSAPHYAIPQSVFGSGGEVIASNANRTTSTLGQPFTGMVSSSSNEHYVGFWYAVKYLLPQGVTPADYYLKQNYPNPFSNTTTIELALPERSHVSIKLYDVRGREVATIFNGSARVGILRVECTPSELTSGIYFCQVTARSEESNKKFSGVKKLAYVR